jgi:hypothetical protein
MAYIDRLADKLSLIARPGVEVEPDGEGLRLKVVTRQPPFDDLIVFSAKPAVDDLAEHDEALIRGFSDFSELVAHTIDGQDPRSVVPLILSQELYNRGVVLNAHGLYDLFDVQVRFLEHDPAKWLRA